MFLGMDRCGAANHSIVINGVKVADETVENIVFLINFKRLFKLKNKFIMITERLIGKRM